MDYRKTMTYLLDRRLKLIVLSAKIANDKSYFEEYVSMLEEIRILDDLIAELDNTRISEKYKSVTPDGQLELL